MAGYNRRKYEQETDGGEATPRPLKAFRLVDAPEGEAWHKKGPTKASSEEISSRNNESRPTASSNAEAIAPPKSVSVSPKPSRQPASAFPEAVSSDGVCVLSVTPEGEGETVAVVLSVPNAETGKPDRVKLHLLVEQYADLGIKVGELTPEQADVLMKAGVLCAAIRRGMGLLQYGDRSVRRLAYKLTVKGVDRETAAAAAAYLAEKGFIREDDTARLRAEQSLRKGWGLRRISEDLRAQGFPSDVIEEVAEGLSDVDFAENCAAMIRKKYGEIPDDRAARQKLMAAMMRLGYDSGEIREAMRRILRDS